MKTALVNGPTNATQPDEFQTAEEFCYALLTQGDLAAKLRPPRRADGRLLPLGEDVAPRLVTEPARAPALRMRPGAAPLPGIGQLRSPEARALCLERFAHHELQAIELFAWMLLAFPGPPLLPGLRRAMLLTLEEEQAHLLLYLQRLEAHGWSLGQSQLSDYLWQHQEGILRAPEPALAFLCAMGLTFEQANLDFSLLYRDGFRAVGDEASAQVLDQVHREEIRHVRVAMHWLRRLKDPAHSEVATYHAAVPFPLSAARAKGRRFDLASRHRAGLSDAFIAYVHAAQPYTPRSGQRGTDGEPRSAKAMPPPQSTSEATKTSAAEGQHLWLLPNLGAEEQRPVPNAARGFLRGLFGAWAALFDAASCGSPLLLPPGEAAAQVRWRAALHAEGAAPALTCLRGTTGFLAWLGTEPAAALAHQQGHVLWGPPPAVVHTVHDKAFAHQQSQQLDLVPPCLSELLGAFSGDELMARDAVATINARVAAWPAWTQGRFTLKPRHGTSGRGRVMGTGELPAPTRLPTRPGAVHPALAQLATRGGCLLEPWLDRVRDLSLQMYIHADGRTEVLGTTTQIVTPSGQILGNRGVISDGFLRSSADASDDVALRQAAARLGAAAAQAGFYGVAGMDAFVFRGPDGAELMRPVVELNARFTTGTVAVGLVRLAERAGLTRGHTAWALLLKARTPSDAAAPTLPAVHVISPLAHGPVLILAKTSADLDTWLQRTFAAPER